MTFTLPGMLAPGPWIWPAIRLVVPAKLLAPDSVKTTDIYRGVAPFVVLQLLMLVIIAAIPEMATWLPRFFYG